MSQTTVISLATQAILMIIMMSAPIILTAMIIGFTVSILQAVTQVQEQTLSFVPKSLSVYTVIIVLGPWLLATILQFTTHILEGIPTYISR